MALTFTVKKKVVTDNSRRHLVSIAIGVAGDYSSGITVTAAGCGLSQLGSNLDYCEVVGSTIPGVLWYWDPTTLKLRASKTGAALSGVFAEAAGADVAGTTVQVVAVGIVNG